ncbi:MAG: sigma-54 dependent transcriptional regulator [Deltaproteobacteria bacterium]|nr:sigma-54 dependent transcriptional regulator [Deltaproteobacteria bacterium]
MADDTHILVVDDERSMREMVAIMLKRAGYHVTQASSGKEAVALLDAGERFDIVVTDLFMENVGGIEVLTRAKAASPECEVILITAFGTAESAVEAMKKGAYDYLAKPFNVDEFLIIVRQAMERQNLIRDNIRLRARVQGRFKLADVVGRSPAMQRVIVVARKVADSTATILVSGESGTGKEVVARAIHFSGPRSGAPFVAVNCGAMPEQLMESELFGHERGSFTGASEDKDGLFKAADGGTVFLDEVGELPMALQVKMLRVLQDHTIRKVGGSKESHVDVRVIAATNRNLEAQVAAGLFRTDLFYRLNVIHIQIPPLRERPEDIPPLIEHMVARLAAERGARPNISPDAMRALLSYHYPGNVRELANILERAATLASSDRITLDDLPPDMVRPAPQTSGPLPESGVNLDEILDKTERTLIDRALERTKGNRTQAAALLGITFRSLRYRLSKHGIAENDGQET